jgi:superfamily II DNA/RNA helicase
LSPTFHDLGASAEITAALAARGITTPTPIQADTIPAALAGNDVAGRAPTGSGKTLAFGIPLAALVSRARPARPRALVLVPTRELAAQVERELRPLLALRKRSVAAFYGGTSFVPQLKALRRGVDVVVACPGRLADLVRRTNVNLDEVELVVVDEADRMADMGFLPEVRRLLDTVRPDRQTLLFSATLDGDVDVLIRRYQRDPHRADVVADEAELDLTSHKFVDVTKEKRASVTEQLIVDHGPTVVFCRTKHGADRLAKRLTQGGTRAVAIHGDRSQAQRERALAEFAAGRATALIATDVAARGIHVDGVACVVHFDFPGDTKDYVHRSGRTGRAGAKGSVVTLVTDADRQAARKLQRDLGLPGFASPGHSESERPREKKRTGPPRRRRR